MMTMKTVLAAVKRRPGRTLAVCVPLLAAASIFTSTTVASAHPEPRLAVSQAEQNAAPAPFVRDFADGLTGKRVAVYKHSRRIHEGWNVDGCDHDYGTKDQCVPWKIPASAGTTGAGTRGAACGWLNQCAPSKIPASAAAAACEWLQRNGFGPVLVSGRDRQNLDTNHDGIACDKGDLGVA